MDSITPCVAGYDLICAGKLVINPVRQMVWSYWHVDLYAAPPQPTPPSLLPVSASTPPTWIADCFRLVGLDPPTTVESPRTDPSQRPCAAMSNSNSNNQIFIAPYASYRGAEVPAFILRVPVLSFLY